MTETRRSARLANAAFLAVAIEAAGVTPWPDACAQTTDLLSQHSTSGQPETVIVTGQRQDETIDTVVAQFIDGHAATNRKTGQYMRDDARPVCPETVGMPPAFDAFVTARVLSVADSVGARTDVPGKCIPNVEILFTDQPQALVKALAEKTRGAVLGMHFLHETPRLMEVTHPIQGWYVTGTRYDEVQISPVLTVDTGGNTVSTDDQRPKIDSAYRNGPERIVTGSHIPTKRISSIVNVLIVVDINKLGGHEIGPVSDYISMLALSEPRSLDECNQFTSIIDLYSSGCNGREMPTAITASDIAYLKGLYAADLGATTVSVQKDSIATGMKANMDNR